MKPLFQLGQTVMTRSVSDWIDDAFTADVRRIRVLACLQKHQCGDWGEVPAEDAAMNNAALRDGDRIMSTYTVDGEKLWIITEASREVTTVLFPEDY